MTELVTQNLKTAIINCFSILKDVKENINTMGRKMKHIKNKLNWNI